MYTSPAMFARVAARLADDGAGVGVGDQDGRAAERLDEAGQVRGVDADAAQQVRRCHDVEPGRLELGDDAVPARGVDEGAVNQHHGVGVISDVLMMDLLEYKPGPRQPAAENEQW